MMYDWVLVFVPTIITAWTSLNLSWGIFTGLAVDRIMKYSDKYHGGHRGSDQTIHSAVWICNIVLFLYLFLLPSYLQQCADFVLVLDIFVTSFFAYLTMGISKWYSICAFMPSLSGPPPSKSKSLIPSVDF